MCRLRQFALICVKAARIVSARCMILGGYQLCSAMDQFVARLLEDPAQIDQLFPVANLASGVSLERWRRFALDWLQRAPSRTRNSDCPGSVRLRARAVQLSGDRGSLPRDRSLRRKFGCRRSHKRRTDRRHHAREPRGLRSGPWALGLQIHITQGLTADDGASSALALALGGQGYSLGAVRWVKTIDRSRQAAKALRPIATR